MNKGSKMLSSKHPNTSTVLSSSLAMHIGILVTAIKMVVSKRTDFMDCVQQKIINFGHCDISSKKTAVKKICTDKADYYDSAPAESALPNNLNRVNLFY